MVLMLIESMLKKEFKHLSGDEIQELLDHAVWTLEPSNRIIVQLTLPDGFYKVELKAKLK